MPHLEEVQNRIDNIEQIEGVVVAMRAMAAAHAQDARRHLAAIRQHEDTVAGAMADAIAMVSADTLSPTTSSRGETAHLQIVVGAAQGFSGLYNESIVSGVLDLPEPAEKREFLVIGQRGISEFTERGRPPIWSANMIAHAAEAPALASRIVDALFNRLEGGEVQRVSVVHADPDAPGLPLMIRCLMPFDFRRIKKPQGQNAPIVTIAPPQLIAGLVEEYVFTEICEALILGFMAENDARMNAMTRTRTNVKRIGQDLKRSYNQARQEETTTEIIELSGA